MWAGAEGRALSWEESKGMRKHPIAGHWREVMVTWETPEDSVNGVTGSDPGQGSCPDSAQRENPTRLLDSSGH